MDTEKSEDEKLFYKNELVWDTMSADDKSKMYGISDRYIDFLDRAKTERLGIQEAVRLADINGFSPIDDKTELKAGDRVYFLNRKKNIILAIIGKTSIKDASNMVGAHIDSPRIDLKANPVYEEENLVLLKTHYYGGIKKYHWVNIPLEMYGVITKKDGTVVDVHIGNDPSDPVFVISDVLPHIGGKIQNDRKAREVIKGEELNVLAGSIPEEDTEVKEKVKLHFLKLLNTKYGVTEEDFLSAEISLVPAFNARYIGLDKGMIGGYGQDDRICSYTSLQAIMDTENPEITSICYLVDKEETGSEGNTGALSQWFPAVITTLIEKTEGSASLTDFYTTMTNMKVLSSDVNAAVNPTFSSIHDLKNAGRLGMGVILTKFSGGGGKGGTNDAHSEFVGWLRKIFDDAGVNWQMGEWGKVDEGGAGTIAKFMARYNSEVIDLGPGLLGMHSTYEISHVADLYMTYKSYLAFYNS